MTRHERFWQNGTLIREVIDGEVRIENLGKTPAEMGVQILSIEHIATPSIRIKARNALGAIGRLAKAVTEGRSVAVSDEEKGRRMEICQGCDYFTGSTCRKCGCHIRFKAKLQTEHCPIGKW